jgi:hypothetical protein
MRAMTSRKSVTHIVAPASNNTASGCPPHVSAITGRPAAAPACTPDGESSSTTTYSEQGSAC